jgi:ABC-type amino acid transport substrate-binding protein
MLEKLGFSKLDQGSINVEGNLTKLIQKRFDSIVDAKVVYLYSWKKMGQKTKDLQEGPMIGEQSHIYVAGDLSFPDDIAKSISDAVAKMKKSGKLQEILDKWTK